MSASFDSPAAIVQIVEGKKAKKAMGLYVPGPFLSV
jgi:hypothetical protein